MPHRAAKACLACRARKVRCDVSQRGVPCNNCSLDSKCCEIANRRARASRFRGVSRPGGPIRGPHASSPPIDTIIDLRSPQQSPQQPSHPGTQRPRQTPPQSDLRAATTATSALQNERPNTALEPPFAHSPRNAHTYQEAPLDWRDLIDELEASAATDILMSNHGGPGSTSSTSDSTMSIGNETADISFAETMFAAIDALPLLPHSAMGILQTIGSNSNDNNDNKSGQNRKKGNWDDEDDDERSSSSSRDGARYEQILDEDARFWDSVFARDARGRNRAAPSSNQELRKGRTELEMGKGMGRDVVVVDDDKTDRDGDGGDSTDDDEDTRFWNEVFGNKTWSAGTIAAATTAKVS